MNFENHRYISNSRISFRWKLKFNLSMKLSAPWKRSRIVNNILFKYEYSIYPAWQNEMFWSIIFLYIDSTKTGFPNFYFYFWGQGRKRGEKKVQKFVGLEKKNSKNVFILFGECNGRTRVIYHSSSTEWSTSDPNIRGIFWPIPTLKNDYFTVLEFRVLRCFLFKYKILGIISSHNDLL
jgi:hypothetical protein